MINELNSEKFYEELNIKSSYPSIINTNDKW